MSVLTPPPRAPRRSAPADGDDLEALIEEARRRARRRRQLYAAAAIIIALAGVAVVAGLERSAPSTAASPEPSAQPNVPAGSTEATIAFVRYLCCVPSAGTLYVVNGNGTGEREVSRGVFGRWSPDGRTIAVTTKRDGNREIYLMSDKGTFMRRLTHNPARDDSPHWAPDGRSILFVRWARDGGKRFAVYVMNADGSGERRLSREVAAEFGPEWSHDGRKIAVTRVRDGNYDVYVMNIDGRAARNLTRSAEHEVIGDWSPDGRRLTFFRTDDRLSPGSGAIHVVNIDGTELRKVASDVAYGGGQWSPDGSVIAFVSLRRGVREIAVVNADGSERRAIVRDSGRVDKPDPVVSWSPDGSKLAFTSVRDRNHDIYLVNRDGTGLRRLTRHPDWDTAPVWVTAKTS